MAVIRMSAGRVAVRADMAGEEMAVARAGEGIGRGLHWDREGRVAADWLVVATGLAAQEPPSCTLNARLAAGGQAQRMLLLAQAAGIMQSQGWLGSGLWRERYDVRISGMVVGRMAVAQMVAVRREVQADVHLKWLLLPPARRAVGRHLLGLRLLPARLRLDRHHLRNV